MRSGLNSAPGLPLLPRPLPKAWEVKNSATGTRTRVAQVRAEYPNQLDYSGVARRHRGKNEKVRQDGVGKKSVESASSPFIRGGVHFGEVI